jgi:hypothetical protein
MPPAPLPPSSLASTTTRFPLALRLLVPWAVLVGAGSGGDGAAPSAVHAVPPGGRLAHFPAELAPGRGGGRAAPLLPALHAAGRAGGPRLPPAPASSWRVSAPPARGLRLRGGGKSKSARARSWKEQSKHHAELRKKSIRKNRNKNPQEATYTKEARENIRKVADARRLRELEENQEHKRRMAEERATDFNHLLRLDYMRANEEADRRRAEKYQTLDDYSDSIERELEELRQKRGESRCLTVPDWREGHPGYWKTVEKEAQNADIDDPEKVLSCLLAPFGPMDSSDYRSDTPPANMFPGTSISPNSSNSSSSSLSPSYAPKCLGTVVTRYGKLLWRTGTSGELPPTTAAMPASRPVRKWL